MMKIRLNLAIKMILAITLLIAIVVTFVTYKNASLFEQVSIDKEESSSISTVELKAFTVDLLIKNYINNISVNIKESLKNEQSPTFISDSDVNFIKVKFFENDSKEVILSGNQELSLKGNKYLNLKLAQFKKFEPSIMKGNVLLFNSSYDEKNLNYVLGFPIFNTKKKLDALIWAQISSGQLLKIFKTTNDQTFFIVDPTGEVIAGTDENLLLRKDKEISYIVNKFSTDSLKTKQQYMTVLKNNNLLVTASKLNYGQYIYSKISKNSIMAPAHYMKANSYYILGLVLSVIIIFIFIFSQQITHPIELLTQYSKQIGNGNLDIVATEKIHSSDEVGDLAKSFDSMVLGLKERDKVKNLFNKFHGTKVTEELLNNEIKLGGKKKEVTVFFSDIRGFTDFSEGHTPEEVVSMLNEYFEVMVTIINDHGGVVDKFIGDAIMAVWGVPNQTDEDSKNAVSACLDMRLALAQLNESRLLKNLTPVKIGMGLHYGEAISGQIGSNERMEFTIIGDAVNTASRIEGATKSFGTDFLISDSVVEKIGNHFILDKAGEAKVQGKSENLHLFKVAGRIQNGKNIVVETEYSSFEAVEDKKSKVAS